MPAQWQIALAVLAGFLIGTLCTWLACLITDQSAPPSRSRDDQEVVGADAEGQTDGAPQGRPDPSARMAQRSQAPPRAARISWWIDPRTWGGVLPERLLAALPTADGLYCGLVLQMSTTGKPTLEFWDRIDDLERQGFVPISASKARAVCDALPRFLDRLEQASGDRRQATEGADAGR